MLNKNTIRKWVLFSVLAVTFSAMAQAQDDKSPVELRNNAYVTLTGTVGDITDADEFTLNYKGGSIKVDTNDYWPDLFAKDALEVLKPGDQITVTGVVDDNYFTKKEIDATSIAYRGTNYSRLYRHKSDGTAYSNVWPYYVWDEKIYENRVGISGTVSNILNDQEFEMKYGTGTIKVDTSALKVLDTDRLNVGDRVMVYGDMDENWFGKRELDADYLVRTDIYQSQG